MLWAAPAASAAPGTITGKVTRDNGGAVISGACVRAVNLNGVPSVDPGVVETTTDSDGDYALNVDPNGRWGVQFYSCPNEPGQSFVAEWWNDSRAAFGDQLTIADGATVTRNASLADGGSIAGVVTGPDGEPVEGVCVTASNQETFESLPVAKTNAQGEYRIGGLVGTYLVAFDVGFEGCAPDEQLLFEYYENTRNSDSAEELVMTDAVHLFGATGVDAQLEAAASITGVVTDHTGAPINNACVSVDFTGEGDGGGFDQTDATGRYTIGGLVPGTYTLEFNPCGNSTDLGEFWQNKPDRESADEITLVAGNQPTEYSAQLSEPTSLTGTVTDPDDDPVQNACVTLFDAVEKAPIGYATTGADGTYLFDQEDFDDLEASQVLVEFDPTCQGPSMLLGEWYDDQPDIQSATPINVPGGAITGINAELAEGMGISGVVTGTGGTTLSGVCVFLSGAGFDNQYAGSTDSAGKYFTGPLPPGEYIVRFVPCNGGGWLPEYFDDSPNRRGATPAVVTTESGVVADAELEPAGSIAGTVTGPDDQPLSNICVTLRKSGTGARVEPGGSAQTAGNGTYVIEGLPTGNYDVRFAPCYSSSGTPNYQTEFYDDAGSAEAADPVSVTAGTPTTGINAKLATGSTISGTLTAPGASGPEPVGGVCVAVDSTDGFFVTDVVTDSSGNYQVTGLTPGEYFLIFNTCGSDQFLREFWQNAYTRAEATPFVVAAGSNTADAVLERGGTLSGRVTGPGGGPAEGVCVDLRDADSGEYLLGEVETDENGEYELSRVPAGQVKVRFSSCSGGSYVAEYFNDAKRFPTATPVTISEGQTTPNVNASLAKAGSISGTVTAPGGDPIDDICVSAFAADDDTSAGRSDGTDNDGEYTIRGLDAGEYKLRFSDCGGSGFATEWWNDKPNRATADPIVVGVGQDVVGRDAELAEQGEGVIAGSVSEPGGGDSSDACVTVYNATTGEPVNGDNVQNGSYRVRGLPAGTYKVGFESCGSANFAAEFWAGSSSDGVRTLAEATTIQLANGETETGIDAELELGARIAGSVTDPGGAGASETCVNVYDAQDPDFVFASREVRPDGGYVIAGLAPGDYKVEFDPGCFGGSSPLEAEFYDNAGSFATAQVIEVGAAGTTVPEIDAQLSAKPPVAVTSGPSGQTAERRPTFGFDAPADGDVECSVDTGTPQWGPCSAADSHTPSADLAPGSYTFRVRATTDWEQTVATRSFTVAGQPVPPVDRVAPKVEFTGGPKGKTKKRKATFRFGANEPGVTYECSVDGKAFKPCTSPVKLKRLRPGKHSFAVRATDAAGNKSAVVERKFKIVKKKKKRR